MRYLAKSPKPFAHDQDMIEFESLEDLITHSNESGFPSGWVLYQLIPLTDVPGELGSLRVGDVVTAKCNKCGACFQGMYQPEVLPPFNCTHCGHHHTGHQFLVAVTDYRANKKRPQAAVLPSFVDGLREATIAEKIDHAATLLAETVAELRCTYPDETPEAVINRVRVSLGLNPSTVED